MKKRGFTLIELMVVVTIIGILAAVVSAKFSDLVKKSKEGATKGGLSSVRSALSVYYADHEGDYPRDDLSSLVVSGKYISAIPSASIPGTGHSDSSAVVTGTSAASALSDDGGWAYVNTAGSQWGKFFVNCSHQNLKEHIWSAY